MVIFGFCKDWAVEKCTEPVFKMFQKPRNEQNKSRYFYLKRPVATVEKSIKFHYLDSYGEYLAQQGPRPP